MASRVARLSQERTSIVATGGSVVKEIGCVDNECSCTASQAEWRVEDGIGRGETLGRDGGSTS
jgi:hypothetical protein